MRKYIKRKTIIILAIVAVVVVGGYFAFFRKSEVQPDFVVAKRGDLIQEVSVTGKVKPASDVDLAFDRGGRVAQVRARVGDRVGSGSILVVLENGDVSAQLAQQEAILKAELSKLEELQLGTRPEELRIQEAKVQSAEIALEDAKKNLPDKIQDAYTKADDAIRDKADQFFTNPQTVNPNITFATDNQTETNLESQRTTLEIMLVSWGSAIPLLNTSVDLAAASKSAKGNLNQVKTFLDLAALALAKLSPTTNLSQATSDGYRSDISTARTNINAAFSGLTTAEEKLRSADSALAVAKNELLLKQAGATSVSIAAEEARVEEIRAAVRRYQADLSKTVITAPIAGVVTKMEAKIGEIVSANSLVVTIISDAEFGVEAYIPEADIAKITIGNSARVTLDAYGEDVVFEAKVVKVDPAETVVDGVPTYKTTFQFAAKDSRIKSGMTANIDILTDTREAVVSVPQRAVITRGGSKFVRILGDNGAVQEVSVKTGLRGSSGSIEILEGVEEGNKVVVFTEEK